MTSLNKKAKNRLDRTLYNTGRKIIKAEDHRVALVELGKTLVPSKRTVITGYDESLLMRENNPTDNRTRRRPRKVHTVSRVIGKVLTPITETKEVYVLSPTGPKDSTGRVKDPRHFRGAFGQSSSLVFLGGKSYPHHGAQRKTRPGEKIAHTEANVENGIGELARQEAKARAPKPTPDIPIIPLDSLPEIGQPEVQQ